MDKDAEKRRQDAYYAGLLGADPDMTSDPVWAELGRQQRGHNTWNVQPVEIDFPDVAWRYAKRLGVAVAVLGALVGFALHNSFHVAAVFAAAGYLLGFICIPLFVVLFRWVCYSIALAVIACVLLWIAFDVPPRNSFAWIWRLVGQAYSAVSSAFF